MEIEHWSSRYVATAIRGLCAEHPEQINPVRTGDWTTCLYNSPNGTHCIAGHFLANEGVPVPDTLEGRGISGVISAMDISMPTSAENILIDAQCEADKMYPWGEVIVRLDGLAGR